MNLPDPFHVLIIGGSPGVRSEIRQMLLRGSQRHYKFTEAETGATGVRAVFGSLDRPPDCILLDCALPDMDAMEVLTALRAGGDLTVCPVVVLTGITENGALVLRAGAQDYVGKGWTSPESVTRALENAVERFALSRERMVSDEELRESEERLRIGRDAAFAISFEWDIERNEVRRFFSRDPLLTATPDDAPSTFEAVCGAVALEDRAHFITNVRAALDAQDGRYENEFRLVHPDGNVAWLCERGQVKRDKEGKAVKLIGLSQDVSVRKRRELGFAFLVDLQKVLSPLQTAAEIMGAAASAIAEHFGLQHCLMVEIDEAEGTATVLHDHRSTEDALSLVGTYRIADFHTPEERKEMAAGRAILINDVSAAPRTAENADRFAHLGIGAAVIAPYVSDTGWKFVLSGQLPRPYPWPAEDAELLTELAARIYLRLERARADDRLRASEAAERARRRELEALMDAIPAAVFIAHDADCKRITGNRATTGILRLAPGVNTSKSAPKGEQPDFEVYREGKLLGPYELPMQQAAATGLPVIGQEVDIVFPDGACVNLYGSALPVFGDDGVVRGAVGAYVDFTQRREAERELRESQHYLQRITEVTPGVLHVFDLEKQASVFINRPVTSILGYSAADIAAMGSDVIPLLMHPDDIPRFVEHMEKVRALGDHKCIEFEHRMRDKSGNWRWFQSRDAVFLRAEDGSVKQLIGTATDITDLKRIEEASNRNAALFSKIIEQAPGGVYVVDAMFRLQQINAEAMPVFKSVDPLIGRDFDEVLHILWGPKIGDALGDIFRHTLTTGERHVSPSFSEERFDIHERQAFEWETQRILLPDGQFGVVCYFRDVTERNRAHKALQESRTQLALGMNVAGVALSHVDFVSGLNHLSAETARLFGLGDTAMVVPREKVYTTFHADDRVEIHRRLAEAADPSGAGLMAMDYRVIRPNGEIRWLRVRKQVFFEDYNGVRRPVRGILAALDITDIKRAELALAEEARRKDEFLAMLGHELRNPLAAIRHAVQIAHESPGDQEACDWAAALIDRQSEQLSRMIEDLLDVARINRGRIELRTQPLDLSKVLHNAVNVTRSIIQQKCHNLTVEIGDNLHVNGDGTRLEQVFVNLLNNAAKYTPEAGRLTLHAQVKDREVVVAIKDNGVGIPGDLLPHVFDIFRQADSTLARAQGGLGIGLSVVKSLVEMHHGSVTMESHADTPGTTVTVRLPLRVASDAASSAMAASTASIALPKGIRVLIVDDHKDAATSLSRLLVRRGCDVRCAHTGPHGVEVAHEFHPEVLLLDIGLPDLDGYGVAQMLRAEPAFSRALFIAITGYAQDGDRERCLAAGFDEHFAKPVSITKLTEAVATYAANQ